MKKRIPAKKGQNSQAGALFALFILIMACSCNTFNRKGGLIAYEKSELLPEDLPFEFSLNILPEIPNKVFQVPVPAGGSEHNAPVRIDIQEVIDLAASKGGGRVIVPGGAWLTGPLRLRNRIDLHFSEGAEVYFSTALKEYLPATFARHQGVECFKYAPLIHAENVSNIAITGTGVLHGQGRGWWQYNQYRESAWRRLEIMAEQEVPLTERVFEDSIHSYLPPSFIQPVNCANILIEDITVMYGPFWTINPLYCEKVIIRGVTVETVGEYGHTRNGDGVNISSCRNVLIEDCAVSTGDDCYTLKSGRGKDGLRVAKPTENVVIRHSLAEQGHGGVVIGSETSGGINNVFIYDCQFEGTDRGIRIKTARGRGASVENVFVRDIQMNGILEEAIVINMLRYTPRLPAHIVNENTPVYRNINISDVKASNVEGYGIRMVGLPEARMNTIHLSNIEIFSNKGFSATDADSVILEKVRIVSDDSVSVELDSCSNFFFDHCLFSGMAKIDTVNSNCQNIVLSDVSFNNPAK